MRADRLKAGHFVVLLGAEVGSVLNEDGLTFVTYVNSTRTGEVLDSDRQVMVACPHDEEEPDDA